MYVKLIEGVKVDLRFYLALVSFPNYKISSSIARPPFVLLTGNSNSHLSGFYTVDILLTSLFFLFIKRESAQ